MTYKVYDTARDLFLSNRSFPIWNGRGFVCKSEVELKSFLIDFASTNKGEIKKIFRSEYQFNPVPESWQVWQTTKNGVRIFPARDLFEADEIV